MSLGKGKRPRRRRPENSSLILFTSWCPPKLPGLGIIPSNCIFWRISRWISSNQSRGCVDCLHNATERTAASVPRTRERFSSWIKEGEKAKKSGQSEFSFWCAGPETAKHFSPICNEKDVLFKVFGLDVLIKGKSFIRTWLSVCSKYVQFKHQ